MKTVSSCYGTIVRNLLADSWVSYFYLNISSSQQKGQTAFSHICCREVQVRPGKSPPNSDSQARLANKLSGFNVDIIINYSTANYHYYGISSSLQFSSTETIFIFVTMTLLVMQGVIDFMVLSKVSQQSL
jgi:hypothetical protein